MTVFGCDSEERNTDACHMNWVLVNCHIVKLITDFFPQNQDVFSLQRIHSVALLNVQVFILGRFHPFYGNEGP
jgi:hypothetical protein